MTHLFKEVSGGMIVATAADLEAAFAKAEANGPPLGFTMKDSGRLVKLLGSRLGKLEEVRHWQFISFDDNSKFYIGACRYFICLIPTETV